MGLLIKPSNNMIIAITNNACIKPVAEYINTPNAHPIIRITAMIYNNDLIVRCSFKLKMFSINKRRLVIKGFKFFAFGSEIAT